MLNRIPIKQLKFKGLEKIFVIIRGFYVNPVLNDRQLNLKLSSKPLI